MKFVSKNVDQMQAFVIINKDGMKINELNGKRIYDKDLIRILAIVNVNMKNHVMLEKIRL